MPASTAHITFANDVQFRVRLMCGIAGAVSFVPDALQRVETMTTCLRHRGPDGRATWSSPNGRIALGHGRLAIIDLTTGEQPMASESGCVITYNGEIYNYLELRNELGAASFRTES